MIKDKNGEEWMWIRRKQTMTGIGNYVASWLIQRKDHLNSSNSVHCKKRLWIDGKIEEDCSVATTDTFECSEYEAFNWWKPIINYEIY